MPESVIRESGFGIRWIRELVFPAVAVIAAFLVGAIFVLIIGDSPVETFRLLIGSALWWPDGIGYTLFLATPLIFTGLAVAIGFRAGLFNIGVEGQLYLGGFAAALAAVSLGTLPGVLKARFGSHEVINTIMLNFIAFALVAAIGRSVYLPATVHTPDVPVSAALPRLGSLVPALAGAPVNVSLLLALAVAAAIGFLLFRTVPGYELRVVGANPAAAEYAGIAIGRVQVLAMALSGAVAGLGGVNFVLGYKHYFEQGFSSGAGFIGIAVALIGRNQPVGVVAGALFFGALSYAGLVINTRVPRELVEILQGLVILSAISAQQLLERVARRMG